MPNTESQKAARKKWNKANMKKLCCMVRNEVAEEFKAYATKNGTTVNALLCAYIKECLKEENDGRE